MIKGLTGAIGCLLLTCAFGDSPKALVERWEELPTPLQSADGSIFVTCSTVERAPMRWPILSFASGVRETLEKRIRPLGSPQHPLSLVIGTDTAFNPGFVRRQMRSGDYVHLILEIPNPDTVVLPSLEAGIGEALLRESVRGRKGKYSAFHWPNWFILGILDTRRNAEWQAQAYEVLAEEKAAGRLPTLEDFFFGAPPRREVAFFFARWVLSLYALNEEGLQNLPEAEAWRPDCIVGNSTNAGWMAYVEHQKDVVFAPGILSLKQYRRWCQLTAEPKTLEDVSRIREALLRATLGRPKALQDVCALYLQAYNHFNPEDVTLYHTYRKMADDAALLLEKTLETAGSIIEQNAEPLGVLNESK